MHTTALAVQVGEHTAILYYSSRRHAGENLQGLLDKREAGLEKPLAMSDALSSNEVADESLLIRCHCLAHGRRKFSDLEEVFPHECQVVLEVIRQVFDHDEQARQDRLSPEARLAYHQAQSQPLMDELKHWLDKQLDDHMVEPNSSLGIVKLLGMILSPGNSRHFPDAISTDPTLRQPASYPLFRPNSRSGFSSLRGTPTRTTDAVAVGSVGQWDHTRTKSAGHDPRT